MYKHNNDYFIKSSRSRSLATGWPLADNNLDDYHVDKDLRGYWHMKC